MSEEKKNGMFDGLAIPANDGQNTNKMCQELETLRVLVTDACHLFNDDMIGVPVDDWQVARDRWFGRVQAYWLATDKGEDHV